MVRLSDCASERLAAGEFFIMLDSQYLRQHYTRLSIIESQGG
jgi:hypothetical protein